jgi:MurNAc alpha-1-phosphate uridylyltransferase
MTLPLKAIVLAAGRGERMRPLTDHTPKPLLKVHGKPLIEWHLEALARDGVHDVVVNCAWLEDQYPAALGDGSRFGLRIRYSMEGCDHGGALETAGGIAKALPLLADSDDDAFWVVSGDIFSPGFRFDAAQARAFADGNLSAHLWLVSNPPFHPAGDFGLGADGLGLDGPGPDGERWTYANLALCRASLCGGIAPGTRAALGPLLFEGMRQRRISAEVYRGIWENVGTPAQLEALNAQPLPP